MRWLLSATSLLLTVFSLHRANGLAVMSVDFGSELMKVGIVSPGVPMEIALNTESKRKTPTVISFRDGVRTIGEDAATVGVRFPKNAYAYLLDLLGKDINHPLVKLYQKRFPYYEILEDKERGTILFKHDEETVFSPEELIAQLLFRAKQYAEESARQPIKECVITVPGYFNQIERKALLQAAQLADIKVLQLINDYMAVALNYGIFRTKDFNDTTQYVMFYDMGATSTTASIVSLQNVKTKERGYVETVPQISVIGVGYDRTLGGLELQLRLRDYLAKKFNELKKTKKDVFENPRALAKLFKEAGRLKNVLSANSEHYAQVEGLLDEIDFRLLVTREEFENLNTDVFERVGYPVEQALKTAGITMDIINQVVLVGAGTRVPKVQEKLQQIVKMDLAKNLNTDEAATMGAVYKAADLSTGFQVKKFITKDAVLFPILATFERDNRQMKRVLFGLMNHYPQKKIITFSKHTEDFSINLNYGELDYLSNSEVVNIGGLNISHVEFKGVAEALEKNQGPDVDTKGIKAHFQMDESGVLNLNNVEIVFEKAETGEADDQGGFFNIGNKISKLFSGNEDVKPVHEEPEGKEEEKKEPTTPPPKAENKTGDVNGTQNAEEKKETKPKMVIVKEPINSIERFLSLGQMSKKQLDESFEKLRKLHDVEREMHRRASALNSLESFVIDVQTKLDETEYTAAAKPDEADKIRAACSEASEWLYEEGSDADAATYEAKLEKLKTLTWDLFKRVMEHRERPEALKALKDMLNGSRTFYDSAKNLTKTTNPDKDVYTDAEIEALEKLISDTESWRDKRVEEQNKLAKHEDVKLTVKALAEKMNALDREMKYLVNKIRTWKPKKVEEKPAEEKNETETEEPKEEEEVAAEEEEAKEETIEPTASEKDDAEKHSEL